MELKDQDTIDYELVEEVLADAECETSAAELQAILCGMLAAGLKPGDLGWLDIVADIINDERELTVDAKELIASLCNWSNNQMSQHDSLAPTLLPDDSYPALDQLEAIAEWCQGFLLGFGLQTGNQDIDNEEVRESLTDLAEISQIEQIVEDGEETAQALVTIVEHIKVAVQIVYWEMVVKPQSGATAIAPGNQTLH
ncbi:UPF0149 family protein [Aliikangiella coralliicola]|uniref:UPF0149 family protein n=1 Tax=Aliikangiella coralliicola TaxID=2592383 RepID=A0A545UI87_9GAMM|nr:UPF0149 family protein [Aliikangiella coralliicola]TQV89186.1 UPF0149 family protein [Aliikangiella coralliicola]